jgi:hypothetical protein
LHGEFIYRDYLEFTPPGTDLIYFGAFELLGPRIWVPNVVVLLLGVLLCWLCFRISRQLVSPSGALMATALFLVQDYGKWLDATHHWFSLLAVLAALAVLLKSTTRARILVGGALLGLASFFSQTRGVSAAVGLALFLIWNRYRARESWSCCFRQLGQLFLSFIAAWAALSSYFIVKVGFARVWYFQTLYVLRYVYGDQSRLHRVETHVLGWPHYYILLYFAIPAICAIALWRSNRQMQASGAARASALIACVGGLMFVEVGQNANFLRVDTIAVPAMVLLVWLLSALARQHLNYVATVLLVGLLGLGVHRIMDRNTLRSQVENLPAGRVATTPLAGEKLAWIARHTTPGEYFFETTYVSMYLPLALRSPAYAALSRQTPTYVTLDCEQLEARRVRYILWSPLDEPRFPELEQFLSQRYQRVWTFSDQDEIWERRP